METIGDRIKAARKSAGLTKAELGRRVKLTDAGIGQMESGKTKNPQPGNLLRIADATNHNIRWLIAGKGPRYRHESLDSITEAYAEAPDGRQLLVDVLLGLRDESELPKGVGGVLDAFSKLYSPPGKSDPDDPPTRQNHAGVA